MNIIDFDRLRKQKEMGKGNPKYILYIENREKPLGFEPLAASDSLDELIKMVFGDRRKFVIDYYSEKPGDFVLTEFHKHFTERKEIAEELIDELKEMHPAFQDFDFSDFVLRFERIIDNIEEELRKVNDPK